MARKTDKQLLLEAMNPGKDIREILMGALESHRGEAHLIELAAAELGLSRTTMGSWCREQQIDIEQFKYRVPAPGLQDLAGQREEEAQVAER